MLPLSDGLTTLSNVPPPTLSAFMSETKSVLVATVTEVPLLDAFVAVEAASYATTSVRS